MKSKITKQDEIDEISDADFDELLNDSLESDIGEQSNNDNRLSIEDVDLGFVLDNDEKEPKKPQKNIFKYISSDNEQTLEERLEELYNEFKKDTTITIANIKEIAFNEAIIKGRWCSKLMAEKVHGKRLKQTYDELIKGLGETINTKSKNVPYLTSKMNRDNIINNDKNVQLLKRQMAESREIQDFLSMIYDTVKGLGYTIKNSLDALNLERGI